MNPLPIDLGRNSFIPTNYRSFFKSGQIKRKVFETRKTGRKPENSLEINRFLISSRVATDRTSDKNLDQEARAERDPDRRRGQQTLWIPFLLPREGVTYWKC
jgi:hypothetical protein